MKRLFRLLLCQHDVVFPFCFTCDHIVTLVNISGSLQHKCQLTLSPHYSCVYMMLDSDLMLSEFDWIENTLTQMLLRKEAEPRRGAQLLKSVLANISRGPGSCLIFQYFTAKPDKTDLMRTPSR